MDNPQPSSKLQQCNMSAVHRLNVGGSRVRGLRYSRALCESKVDHCCTHRLSLLPIEWLSEPLGSASGSRQRHLVAENLCKLGHLEEVKVITRYL